MDISAIKSDTAVKAVQEAYATAGAPFEQTLNETVANVTSETTDNQDVIKEVVTALIHRLAAWEKTYHPKHRAGRIIQAILSLFS